MIHATITFNVDACDDARNDVDVNIDARIVNALKNAFNDVTLISHDDDARDYVIVTFTCESD